MSQSGECKVLQIPQERLAEVWPVASPLLLLGRRHSASSLGEIASGLINGTDQLWIIIDDKEIHAAFVTAAIDDGSLAIYGLGGSTPRRWATALDEAVCSFARSVGISVVRFIGRKAWLRLIPALRDCGAIGSCRLMERTV